MTTTATLSMPMPTPPRRLHLTTHERAVLSKPKIVRTDRASIPDLWEPFRDVYLTHVRPLDRTQQALWRAFRCCGEMMLALDGTYWAFTWERLLAWRAADRVGADTWSAIRRHQREQCWTEVTATLFFLGVLPFREGIYKYYHKALARKWLGDAQTEAIEARFVATASAIGYQDERQVRKMGVSVLLGVMLASGKRELAELRTADFTAWETTTTRSRRVATGGVTMARRVLGAMGYLAGEAPRATGGASREYFTWGRAAPPIVDTFVRFLADFGATRRPETIATYQAVLRRFGDWLAEFDPSVTSVADVRRPHIEAYKQAVIGMRVGDYVSPAGKLQAGGHLGRPFSTSFQARCLSCVRTFFAVIDALEYPERPGRQLFLRGDLIPIDEQVPRFIPDDQWQRFIAAVEALTSAVVAKKRLPGPYERTRAILGVLLEAGLRAGELCRLDTGCIVTAQEAAIGGITYWLRVPLGKLHTDRMIPIRPGLVELIDAWMRRRGPQPLLWDERTGRLRDYLFAWQGGTLSPHTLNDLITALCTIAAIPRVTSHQFRHTLAVQWRRNGMRIETIGRMLGHTDLKMTLRYAAVMPETVRQEFDAAFAAIDEEHRTTAQVRVYLSPDAHLAASTQWRESLWVDLGVGFCGLSAYLPCDSRLACLPCPQFVPTPEHLPLYGSQREHLIELRMLGGSRLPADRRQEVDEAVAALDRHVAALGGLTDAEAAPPPAMREYGQ